MEIVKQKIRNTDSTILVLTFMFLVLLLIGSVFAELNSGSETTTQGTTTSSRFEKEIELEVGESVEVATLEILLNDLALLKSNPSVYQATIKYGVLPEGLNKPVTSLTLTQGEKNLVTLTPTNFVISFKSVSDDGKKAKFLVYEIKITDESDDEFVKVYVYPEKQVSDNGKATYEVVVKDLHPLTCKEDDEISCLGFKTYKYVLSFESKDSIGSFSETEFEIQEGTKKSVELIVQTENKGVHPFIVVVNGDDAKDYVKGVLVYGEKSIPTEPAVYFIGGGFVLNEDESEGKIVELKILKREGVLDGKLWFEAKPFKIEGKITEENVIVFDILVVSTKEKVGSFSGNVKNFKNFLLLRGDLQAPNDKSYGLTAMGKRKNIFKVIDVESEDEEESSETIAVDETVTVTKETSSESLSGEDTESALEKSKEDLYIRPIKVKKEKFLWIFPSGKKVVEVEIIKGDKVIKKVIKEKTEVKVEGYNVGVGSLDDEENIEINVEKA